MSHSKSMKDNEGHDWVALYNGDWSGEVKLYRLNGEGGIAWNHDHVIPGEIVKALAGAAAELTVEVEVEDLGNVKRIAIPGGMSSYYDKGEADSQAVIVALESAIRQIARFEVTADDGFTVRVRFACLK